MWDPCPLLKGIVVLVEGKVIDNCTKLYSLARSARHLVR